MISTVWPCLAARVPMAAAMLPEPMMLMVVMICFSLRYRSAKVRHSSGR
jgi:hypothetical protein